MRIDGMTCPECGQLIEDESTCCVGCGRVYDAFEMTMSKEHHNARIRMINEFLKHKNTSLATHAQILDSISATVLALRHCGIDVAPAVIHEFFHNYEQIVTP